MCDTVKVLKDDGKSLLKALVTDLENSVFTYSEIRPNANIASLLPRSIIRCLGNKPKRMKWYVTRFKDNIAKNK